VCSSDLVACELVQDSGDVGGGEVTALEFSPMG
jgi:hypothetical protein